MVYVKLQVMGRALRVDHKHNYQVPKEHGDEDELTKKLRDEGCAPSLGKSTLVRTSEDIGYLIFVISVTLKIPVYPSRSDPMCDLHLLLGTNQPTITQAPSTPHSMRDGLEIVDAVQH